MDEQQSPRSEAGSREISPQTAAEGLQPGVESSPAEFAPAPGSSPASKAVPSGGGSSPKLTADQVAAAIAAAPTQAGPPTAATAPSTANDVDVIEPEWVDKAEHEIATHVGDPYGEEEAIEDLQQDYLDKRYGYKVANPNSSDSSKPEGT